MVGGWGPGNAFLERIVKPVRKKWTTPKSSGPMVQQYPHIGCFFISGHSRFFHYAQAMDWGTKAMMLDHRPIAFHRQELGVLSEQILGYART